jgi:hypothetical protein
MTRHLDTQHLDTRQLDTRQLDTRNLDLRAPLTRCGEMVGRASAGLIIVAIISFAFAAIVADIL